MDTVISADAAREPPAWERAYPIAALGRSIDPGNQASGDRAWLAESYDRLQLARKASSRQWPSKSWRVSSAPTP